MAKQVNKIARNPRTNADAIKASRGIESVTSEMIENHAITDEKLDVNLANKIRRAYQIPLTKPNVLDLCGQDESGAQVNVGLGANIIYNNIEKTIDLNFKKLTFIPNYKEGVYNEEQKSNYYVVLFNNCIYCELSCIIGEDKSGEIYLGTINLDRPYTKHYVNDVGLVRGKINQLCSFAVGLVPNNSSQLFVRIDSSYLPLNYTANSAIIDLHFIYPLL